MFRGLLYLAELGAAAIFVILLVQQVIQPLLKNEPVFPLLRARPGSPTDKGPGQ